MRGYRKSRLPSIGIEFSKASRQWLEEQIMELSQYTDRRFRGHTRLAFSQEDKLARQVIMKLMKAVGLSVRIDPAGNIVGRRDGKRKSAPVIMTGSHIDTVKDGGRFDGIAGVISAIAAIRYVGMNKLMTAHPLEVVIFTSEEVNEFGVSAVGSRAMTGKLNREQLSRLENRDGLSLGEAIEFIGGNSRSIERATRKSGEILAYLELHIEQGSILESLGIPIGVVSGIAGISRALVTVSGSADHAGTTPMNKRKDALIAAALAIRSLERIACRKYLRDTVATIGLIENFPNAGNVIAGKVVMQTDIRSTRSNCIDSVERSFQTELAKIATKRRVEISFCPLVRSSPAIMDEWVKRLTRETLQEQCVQYHDMISGAGHDASHMSEITRAGMIFIPSRGGKSHCPEEWTDFDDVTLGAKVLSAIILKIDERAKEFCT